MGLDLPVDCVEFLISWHVDAAFIGCVGSDGYKDEADDKARCVEVLNAPKN